MNIDHSTTPDTTKTYTDGKITVVWKPAVCIHSKVCWTQLIQVFNPKARPWINMAGADTDRIVEQVDRCPSKALSYFRNEENAQPENVQAENSVEPVPNGPLLVNVTHRVKGTDGQETLENRITAFCRCGASRNKPFCDGSHARIGFVG